MTNPVAASAGFPLDVKEPRKAKSRGISPIRLTVVCGVLLSLIVAGVTALFLIDLRKRTMAENERTLLNTALMVARQIEHIFATVENVQSEIVSDIAAFGFFNWDDGSEKLPDHSLHLKLRDKAAGMPFVGSLTVVDAQGRMVNFSRQWPVPAIDVSDRDFFKAFLLDPNLTFSVGTPVRNRATGTWVMHLARKISGPAGEFLGLTSAAIELQYFQKTFSDISFEHGSGISLFRDDGTLFARNPRIESEIGRRFPAAVGLRLVSGADHGVGVSVGGIDGQVRLVAAHRISGSPLLVATTKTVALLFADWKRTATYAIIVAALTIIAIAAFAILFVKMFRNYQALVKARAQRESVEKLKDQSLKFKITLDNMPQGVMMFDSSSRMIVCNERYLQMYGLSAESVGPGLTLLELIKQRKETGSFQGDPDEYCLKILDQIAQNQLTSHSAETVDGRTIHVLNRPMAGGGWVATHEDITEQRKLERERDLNQKFLDLIIDNVPSTIVVKNARDLSYALINRAGEDYFGIPRGEMIGRTAYDFLPKETADYLSGLDKKVFRATQQPVTDEHTLDMPGGKKHVASSTRLCIRDQNGEPQYILAVVNDITAQREADDRLRAQKEQLDAAITNMSQGLIMFDASERIVMCNQRYIDMCGLSPDVVAPGRTFSDLLRVRQARGGFSGDVEAYRLALINKLTMGESVSAVTVDADGRSFRVINVPMAAGGWVATHEDVTAKLRAEQVNEQQKRQLDAALENMPHGLCLFDAAQRLVVCNQQYADLYGLNAEQIKPGTTISEIVEHQVVRGTAPDDHESRAEDVTEAVGKDLTRQSTYRLKDGRYISVAHRPLADGGWVATHEDVTEERRRDESFRLLFEGSPVPMWVIDMESLRFIAVNEAAIAHYGYSRERFMSMTVPELRPAEDREKFSRLLKTESREDLVDVLTQHSAADGSRIDVCVYSRALTYAGRDARMAVIHDITKIKLAEDTLRGTQAFLDAIVENVPQPIIVKSAPSADSESGDFRFTLINRAAEQFFGIAREQMIGKCPHDVYTKDHADFIVAHDNEALQGGAPIHVSEHAIKMFKNDSRIVTTRKVAIRDDQKRPRYLLTLLEDVTERSNANKRITYLAHNDSLTDLPNRATFVEYFSATLDEASRGGEQFSILCLDLDRFKEANDTYGHMVGDELLRKTARRLQAAAAGAFLARIGGDEFALIIKDGSQPASAEALGERVLAALKGDFEIEGHRLQLGLSIGGAVYPADGADAKTLMANADAALYQAKVEARGSVRFFDAELATRLRDRRNLQKDIQLAITRGEFFLHYQPQEKMASKETVGFEALIRWQCPKRGLVAPGSFIPVAEESGLIVPLGEWILREACREAASWPEPLTVAVNISPIQFHHGDLPALVHSILLETGLAPARLELEITEGVLIDDFSRAVSILRKLKSLGVQIAMDDFGSGYSSLSYLHSFPFDKIKIDRSFVGDLAHNHHSMAIVRAIITLGHSLEVPVLAEGVETEAQRQFLVREGCDEVQGYLMGRPRLICDYAQRVGRQTAAHNNYAAVGGSR